MTQRPHHRGISLVAVLIATALVALVATGFARMLRNFQKLSANTQKKAAKSTLNGNVQALLSHRLSCLETFGASRVNYGIATEQRGFTLYAKLAAGGMPQPTYREKDLLSGLEITELGVKVGPNTRGARHLRVRMLLTKKGDSLHATQFEERYWVHVLIVGGVLQECFYVDGPSALTLTKIEDLAIPASLSQPRASMMVTNPAHVLNERFNKPGWEPNPQPPGDIPVTDCQYAGGNGVTLCPATSGPLSPPLAPLGNRLSYSFNSKASMGIGTTCIDGSPIQRTLYMYPDVGSPTGEWYQMRPLGFGAILAFRLETAGALVKDTVTTISDHYGKPGFVQHPLTIPMVDAEVFYAQSYNFRLRFSSNVTQMTSAIKFQYIPPPPPPPAIPPPPPPPICDPAAHYFVNWFPAAGSVFHYIDTPPLP